MLPKREAPFQQSKYLDEDIEVDFSEYKSPDQEGFVIATSPLTDENWINFRGGELIVFKNGKKKYSSLSNNSDISTQDLSKLDVLILKKIRDEEEKVSVQQIYSSLALSRYSVLKSIKRLVEIEYIRQDRRDNTPWDDKNSTYYTLRKSRLAIDNYIHSNIGK